MLSIALWLLFIGNYLILFSFVHLNLYVENMVFYIYSVTALLLGFVIFPKIRNLKIDLNLLLVVFFILTIILSTSITFHSFDKGGIAKLLYIVLCIVIMVESYILGLNRELFIINFTRLKSLSLFSLIIMIVLMFYEIFVLRVFRIAGSINAIGTSRAIAFGFLIVFLNYFFKKKYLLSAFFYFSGLIIVFLSGTRQVFISYLFPSILYPLIPYFKGTKLFTLKNITRYLILFLFLIALSFSIYETKVKGGEINTETTPYLNVVFQRYHGGYHSKFAALNEREILLVKTLDVIYNNPIFGDFQYNEKLGNFAHLMLIDIYASFGIIPLLIFVFINFIVIIKFNSKMMREDYTYFFFMVIFVFLTIPSLLVTTFLIHPFYYFVLFYLLGFKKDIPEQQDSSQSTNPLYSKLTPA